MTEVDWSGSFNPCKFEYPSSTSLSILNFITSPTNCLFLLQTKFHETLMIVVWIPPQKKQVQQTHQARVMMSFARKILDLQIFQFEIRYCISFSVTRFGKISPLWHNFKSLGQFFEGLISIWKKFNLTLAKMLSYRASLHCCRWPHTLKQFSHLVTLISFLVRELKMLTCRQQVMNTEMILISLNLAYIEAYEVGRQIRSLYQRNHPCSFLILRNAF